MLFFGYLPFNAFFKTQISQQTILENSEQNTTLGVFPPSNLIIQVKTFAGLQKSDL